MDPSEERYHPTLWSKRLRGSTLIRDHLDYWKRTCPDVHERIECSSDVRYGPGPRDVYDVFGTDLPEGSPMLIFVHGGYWQEESVRKESYRFLVNNLYRNGIVAVLLEYEVCPWVTVEEIVGNVTTAIRTVLERCSKSPKGVRLVGHSAGAQLILEAYHRLADAPIESLVLLCGVYDLRPLVSMTLNAPLGLDQTTATALSPSLKEFSGTAKFVVVTAEYDCPALIEDGDRMYERLKKCGVQTEKVHVPGVDHFDVVERLTEVGYELSEAVTGPFERW